MFSHRRVDQALGWHMHMRRGSSTRTAHPWPGQAVLYLALLFTLVPTKVVAAGPATATPTNAPTLGAFTIVESFCGDGSDPCRVEGGETFIVVGRGFGEVSTGSMSISIGGASCAGPSLVLALNTSVAAEYVGYEFATCKTPCFSRWGADLPVVVSATCKTPAAVDCLGGDGASVVFNAAIPFRGDATVIARVASAYVSQGVANMACVDVPTISSVACINAAECPTVSGSLMVPPNSVIEVTGTGFGKEMPSGTVRCPGWCLLCISLSL